MVAPCIEQLRWFAEELRVAFFEDYLPVQDWIEDERSILNDLDLRHQEVTYGALLASVGVDEAMQYGSWWDILGAGEVRDPVQFLDDPDETDPDFWLWPE